MNRDRRWLALPVILAATFMYGFDFNVVNVALPTLQHELHAGPAALELVTGGYAFSYAAGLVTGGRLGDLLGYRRMFSIGMGAFTVASLLCGLAQAPAELAAARLVQGLAAAVMVPQVLAMITAMFPAGERPRALAWFGVTAGASGLCGQVIGGLLLSADVPGLGWRAIFLINIPVGVLVLALAKRLVPDVATSRRARLDPLGAAGVSAALALALAPLTFGQDQGWPAWTLACLAASAPVMAAALAWEQRLARAGGQPLVDLSLFRQRSFAAGLAISAAFMAAFTSSVFISSLLLQDGLGLTALRAGLSFGPMALTGIAAPLIGRRLIPRFGPFRVMVAGSLINATSLLTLALALRALGGAVTLPWIITTLAAMGLGNMLILPALIGVALADIRPEQAGVASGTLNTTQQFAGSAGIAAIGALFFAALGPHPGRASYAHATASAVWIDLGLTLVIAALSAILAPPARLAGNHPPAGRGARPQPQHRQRSHQQTARP
jgi:EmrB/QacA subfamily drug resistance transporter